MYFSQKGCARRNPPCLASGVVFRKRMETGLMPPPIIIIGAARSGTKFLRDVLASGDKTAVVPYDVNYVWRRGVAWDHDDVLDPESLTGRRKKFIVKSLSGIARLGGDQRLIEKTVANTLRVPFVDAVYPDAVYVHLIRNGSDVAESAMRQWKAPPDWRNLIKKAREMPLGNLDYIAWFGFNSLRGVVRGNKGGNVWGPRYPGVEKDAASRPLAEVCALQWRNCVEIASADFDKIEAQRVFNIRYEDLVAGPEALENLVKNLGLPEQEKIMDTYRANVKPTRGTGFDKMSESDADTVRELLTPTLAKLGYSA